jgi:hypothetical protein
VRFRKSLGVVAASVALSVGVVPQAFAAPDHHMYSDDDTFPWEDSGAKVEFTEYGDIVKVCDVDEDGYAAYLFVYDQYLYGRKIYTVRAAGNGHCTTYRASMGGKYNLPEKKLGFLICVGTSEATAAYCDSAYWVNDH